jgi:hypothetical protein
MSVRVLILSIFGAALAIFAWLPSRAPDNVCLHATAEKAHLTQIHTENSCSDHGASCIDSCLRLRELADLAFSEDETEQLEEESPPTLALPPRSVPNECQSIKLTGLTRSFESAAAPPRHAPLRC